jgi:hypothetical protein
LCADGLACFICAAIQKTNILQGFPRQSGDPVRDAAGIPDIDVVVQVRTSKALVRRAR